MRKVNLSLGICLLLFSLSCRKSLENKIIGKWNLDYIEYAAYNSKEPGTNSIEFRENQEGINIWHDSTHNFHWNTRSGNVTFIWSDISSTRNPVTFPDDNHMIIKTESPNIESSGHYTRLY